ncbi:hypothetical protein [Streptomyces sp. CAU 1734]|uniref:SCO2583 family membrane protein n=1 Tax=Streptomyces sp. CAU 1734 TaxID=3140360 RepID=UPI00326018B2
MAGRGGPPEGTPDGLPGGGEDEYRSVVFDESFVQAARLQELSARERMGEPARAVRSLPVRPPRRGSGTALLLVLLVALAFGTATYMSLRAPQPTPSARRADPLRITLVPLSPSGSVPGGTPGELYARGPAARFRIGASGITLPIARPTESFSEGQVIAALTTAKDYLVESSLAPDVLTGGKVRSVRVLLDPDQQAQFDLSMAGPAADGRHAATGWLVRYDPAEVALADPAVRVRGALRVTEVSPDILEVTSDHTFAYALRPAAPPGPPAVPVIRKGAGATPPAALPHRAASGVRERPLAADRASLFTVRREVRFRFDRDDLRRHRTELVTSQTQAGPQSCSDDSSGTLRPLLAGERAERSGPAVTNPYAPGTATVALCGSLAPQAQPSPGSLAR